MNDPATRWTYVPVMQHASDEGYVQIPMNSPQYHLRSVAPTRVSYCEGCVPNSTAYTYNRVSPQ
ncbi:MAG TPA: hypothetical protein VKY65_02790 [Alphaproteobacteria bacterium]|nr:hypothetical protein [Alphaproteobacteria bacterium]